MKPYDIYLNDVFITWFFTQGVALDVITRMASALGAAAIDKDGFHKYDHSIDITMRERKEPIMDFKDRGLNPYDIGSFAPTKPLLNVKVFFEDGGIHDFKATEVRHVEDVENGDAYFEYVAPDGRLMIYSIIGRISQVVTTVA